jgi:hypothetical protein
MIGMGMEVVDVRNTRGSCRCPPLSLHAQGEVFQEYQIRNHGFVQ